MFGLLFFCLLVVSSAHYDTEHTDTAEQPRYYPNNMPDYVPGDNVTMGYTLRKMMTKMWYLYNDIVHNATYPPGKTSGDSNSWDCYGGACGLAMVYYKQAVRSNTNDDRDYFLGLATDYIRYSLSQVVPHDWNVGFLRGANGVYTMCALILRTTDATKSNWCIDQLRQSVITVSQNNSLPTVGPGGTVYGIPNELDFGRAGLIMAALSITESGFWDSNIIPRDAILQVAHTMFDHGVLTGTQGVLVWNTITASYTQYGQNHGSTGIMMQFFRLPELFQNATVDKYVRSTLDFFLTIQFPSGNFPTPLHPPYPSVPDILVQWCHGGPGFVPILGEAFLRYGDSRYAVSMARAIDNTWEKGLLTKGLQLCHGISGNTYMLFYANKVIPANLTGAYRGLKFQEYALTHPEVSQPGVMIQNYPWVLYGSSYLSAMILWSDLLYSEVDFAALGGLMPGFGVQW